MCLNATFKMQSSDIPSDQLSSLLPNDLILEALNCPEDWPWNPASVTPLESRLHSYKQVRPTPVPLRLYPLLQSQGVFSEALGTIQRFAHAARPRLRAEAVSFTPTHCDKENIKPHSLS